MSAARNLCRRCLAAAIVALAIASFGAPAARAQFGLGSADVYFAEANGSPASQAGSHPFSVSTAIALNTSLEGGFEKPDGALKDLEVELPPGLVGIPAATPRCSGADFADIDKTAQPQPLPHCSNDSAIGYVDIGASFKPVAAGGVESGAAVIYNLEPAPGTVAKFGFVYLSVPVTIEVKLSEEAPYRVIALLRNTAQPLLIYGATLTLWGYPASAGHDPFRGSCFGGIEPGGTLVSQGSCPVSPAAPATAFLTLPRACLGPLTTTFAADSWEAPGVFAPASALTHDDALPPNPLGFEACEGLGFAPVIDVAVSSHSADSPTGLDFSVDVEDEGVASPTKKARSDVRKVVATLPKGVTVNPSAADGLSGCSTEQYERESLASAPGEGCPEASKVGTVSVESPLVDESLSGALFVAEPDDPATQAPHAENPFDSFLAVYLVLRNRKLGVIVKQAGRVEPDPQTGQLTATFDEVPQLPFSHLEARFRDGPRAPLASPGRCGVYVAEAEQTLWALPGAPLTTTANFEVTSGQGGGPCPPAGPAPFAPLFSAGTTRNNAGTYAPLSLRLTRQDGEGEVTRFSSTLPPGLVGKLAGVARCPDRAVEAAKGKTGLEEIADPSCPANSEIGHVLAGAGVGPSLTYVPGRIYLGGPVGRDPLSVVVITPAVAGPFDIGNVVVREGLTLDPTSAEVEIDGSQAAPIPQILKGIPLRLRDLRIYIDRQDFILNPTSCEPFSVRAAASASSLAQNPPVETDALLSARFQAADCASLGFNPKLSFRLRGATTRTAHPAFRAELEARAGDSNIGRVAVILPRSQFIDNAHLSNPCTRVQFNEEACPATSVLGWARAFSPLLDQPLEGRVYFRANGGERSLPDIVADLNGEVHIVLVGHVDSVQAKGTEVSRIRSVFETVPDAPVSKFVLSLYGGKRGLLQNSRSLCAQPQRADVRMTGHNGRRKDFRQPIKTSCRKKR